MRAQLKGLDFGELLRLKTKEKGPIDRETHKLNQKMIVLPPTNKTGPLKRKTVQTRTPMTGSIGGGYSAKGRE